jgi:hypothetical protein
MRIAILLLVSAAFVSGCGLRGDLERPVPLWGNPPNEGPLDPRTIKAAEEAAQAEKERQEAERAAREAQQPAQPAQPTPP